MCTAVRYDSWLMTGEHLFLLSLSFQYYGAAY